MLTSLCSLQEADNPEQHAGMCQPACSEAFGQAAIGHEHQLGQDVPDSQQQTGGAGTLGRSNAASLQPPLCGLHFDSPCARQACCSAASGAAVLI